MRTIGIPDSQRPDKLSSTVIEFQGRNIQISLS
jgi:hypothetical protein